MIKFKPFHLQCPGRYLTPVSPPFLNQNLGQNHTIPPVSYQEPTVTSPQREKRNRWFIEITSNNIICRNYANQCSTTDRSRNQPGIQAAVSMTASPTRQTTSLLRYEISTGRQVNGLLGCCVTSLCLPVTVIGTYKITYFMF